MHDAVVEVADLIEGGVGMSGGGDDDDAEGDGHQESEAEEAREESHHPPASAAPSRQLEPRRDESATGTPWRSVRRV